MQIYVIDPRECAILQNLGQKAVIKTTSFQKSCLPSSKPSSKQPVQVWPCSPSRSARTARRPRRHCSTLGSQQKWLSSICEKVRLPTVYVAASTAGHGMEVFQKCGSLAAGTVPAPSLRADNRALWVPALRLWVCCEWEGASGGGGPKWPTWWCGGGGCAPSTRACGLVRDMCIRFACMCRTHESWQWLCMHAQGIVAVGTLCAGRGCCAGMCESLFAFSPLLPALIFLSRILLDGDAIQQELLKMTSQRTVPSVWLAGKHIGGCDDTLQGIQSGVFSAVAGASISK